MQASAALPRFSTRLPRWLFDNLFSFETTLIFFLFAGRYKADPRFSWIPVDLTLMFFLLSVAIGLWIMLREKIYLQGVNATFAGGAFIFWCVVTYGWTVGQDYASDKLFSLLFLNFWCIIASSMIIANNPKRITRFFTMLMAFGAWMMMEAVRLYFSPEWTGFIGLSEGDYLGVGRVISLAGTVAIAVWMFSRTYSVKKILCTVLIGVCFFVLLIGGGKGPLFALVLSTMIPLGLSVRLSGQKILVYKFTFSILLMMVLVTLAIIYIIKSGASVMTLDRAINLFSSDDGDVSANVRLFYYDQSIYHWFHLPIFGNGIGSFPILVFGMDVRSFPHNIILEIILETGIVGLCFFLLFLYSLIRNINFYRLKKEPVLLCAVMLTVNMTFNAMVSGDLPDNRALFVMLGLLAMRPMVGNGRNDCRM